MSNLALARPLNPALRSLALQVTRVKPQQLFVPELNLAMALLVSFTDVRVTDNVVEVKQADQWRAFSPMTSADDLLTILKHVPLVLCSSERGEPAEGNHYSCHAYFGNTEAESDSSIPLVVGQACASLLSHLLAYGEDY